VKRKPKEKGKAKRRCTENSVSEIRREPRHLESLLEMEGLGKEHWKGIDPDEYVRKLREGWE
jgi:hypothetical protein